MQPSAKPTHKLTASLSLEQEKAAFQRLQQQFAQQYESVFNNDMAYKTVIIVPSFTLDPEILAKVDGALYYEERLLCLLMLLRMPHTRIIYVTSMPIDPAIVDYYIHLLPGITSYHAMQRLTLLSCFDAGIKPLTEKILERPRLLQRIRENIPPDHLSHIACFNVTDKERQLAVALNVPIYGCDPDLLHLGSKSMGRKLFKQAGINVPPGFEDLHTRADVAHALTMLKQEHPHMRKAVVKVNEGFSGDGNAIFSYRGAPHGPQLADWVNEVLPSHLVTIEKGLGFDTFMQKMQEMGGIVEAFVEGDIKTSPSVQCIINPLGGVQVASTHDQLLGGESNQVYQGATFPADPAYAPALGEMGRRISEAMRDHGVIGRFAVDFISVKQPDHSWKHYALEINLRKGGTTHPYLMLQFLTQGNYVADEGMYYTANHQQRFYVCSDNLRQPHYRGLTPHDMIDIAMCNGLLYDGSSQEGVMFHLISTLSQFGKLGVVCIGTTPQRANMFYEKTIEVLDREGSLSVTGPDGGERSL